MRILKLGVGAGFEPAAAKPQSAANQDSCVGGQSGCAQRGAQDSATVWQELALIAEAWPKLAPDLRQAILTIIKASR